MFPPWKIAPICLQKYKRKFVSAEIWSLIPLPFTFHKSGIENKHILIILYSKLPQTWKIYKTCHGEKPIRFTVSLHWIFQLLMNRAHTLPKKREKIFEISYPPNNTQSSCPSNITHLKQTHLAIFNFKGNINFPKKWA